jgi:hypothetical protein
MIHCPLPHHFFSQQHHLTIITQSNNCDINHDPNPNPNPNSKRRGRKMHGGTGKVRSGRLLTHAHCTSVSLFADVGIFSLEV